jgi:hypothetical protein
MKHVEIKRMYNSFEQGVLGMLFINSAPFCVTLELPYLNNEVNISCIPAASYLCAPYSSPKYPNVYQVLGVPGRTSILFHKGNVIEDTEGCILLGNAFDKFTKHRMVYNSGATFKRFREEIEKKNFNLTITELF